MPRPRESRDPSPVRKNKDKIVDDTKISMKKGSSSTMLVPRSPGGGESERRKDKKESGGSGGNSSSHKPAFDGSKFDRGGYCLRHPSVQLVNPMKDDDGKLVYQELKVSCPNCQAAKNRTKKGTSLGGGKVRQGHRVHGAPSRDRPRSKSRERGGREEENADKSSRSRGRDKSVSRGQRSSRSKSRNGEKQRREYDTPFDPKGRCHYHKNVQLATKKMTGGWKMLHNICPKCMEDKFGEAATDGEEEWNSASATTATVVSMPTRPAPLMSVNKLAEVNSSALSIMDGDAF